MSKKMEAKEVKSRARPDTIVIAGFAKLPQTITRKNSSNYIAVEFEIESTDSKVVDIYSTILPFVEKEILYQTCLGSNIEAGIKKAIEQLDKRFFGTTKRAIITALEDAYKCHRKIMKTRRASNLNIKIETLISKSNRSRPIRRRKSQAFDYIAVIHQPRENQILENSLK